jgi:two-component system OmpR family sensor kinase
MESQRRFVADAAHELRSPMTALSLQAERLAAADLSPVAQQRLMPLRRGIERGRKLIDQLLTLARVQSTATQAPSSVSVFAVYRRVLEDLLPLAEAKNIDIGVEGEQDLQVMISDIDLTAVVKNLVDNAIRYTPEGGRIDLAVSVDGDRARLIISDTGPGIALEERQRVFDPFYRSLGGDEIGSGLGLSIVQAIVERSGAEVKLGVTDAGTGRGLRVEVWVQRV